MITMLRGASLHVRLLSERTADLDTPSSSQFFFLQVWIQRERHTPFISTPLRLVLSHVRLCDPMNPAGLFCPWDSPGRTTGVGCHFLLQGIFPTQGLTLSLLRWQVDSLPLNRQGSPIWWVVFLFYGFLYCEEVFDLIRSHLFLALFPLLWEADLKRYC